MTNSPPNQNNQQSTVQNNSKPKKNRGQRKERTVKKYTRRKTHTIYKKVQRFIKDPENTWLTENYKNNIKKWTQKGSTYNYWYGLLDELIDTKRVNQHLENANNLLINQPQFNSEIEQKEPERRWRDDFEKDTENLQNFMNNTVDEKEELIIDLTKFEDAEDYVLTLLQAVEYPIESDKLITITTKYLTQKGKEGEYTKVITQAFLLGLIEESAENKGEYYDETYKSLIKEIRTGLAITFRIILNDTDNRKKSDAGYFPYKHKIDLDLSDIQLFSIYKLSQNQPPKEQKEQIEPTEPTIKEMTESLKKLKIKIESTKDRQIRKKDKKLYNELITLKQQKLAELGRELARDDLPEKSEKSKEIEIPFDDGDLNCFINCLEYYNFNDNACLRAKELIINGMITMGSLELLAKELKVGFDVYQYRPKNDSRNFEIKKYNKRAKKRFNINFNSNHYFPDYKIQVTHHSLCNYKKCKRFPEWWKITGFKKNGKPKRSNSKYLDTKNIVRLLVENKDELLEKISTEELMKYNLTDYDPDLIKPQLDKSKLIKKPKGKQIQQYTGIYVFDTETTPQGVHKDFCGSIQQINPETEESINIGTEYGEGYLERLFNKLPKNKWVKRFDKKGNRKKDECLPILAYAHNLKYDFSFVRKFSTGKCDMIKNGGSVLQVSGYFFNRKIIFRDSYCMITQPLSKFGEMFQLETEKDIMPYNAYTRKSIKQKSIRIKTALRNLKNKPDKKQFLENIEKLQLFTTKQKKAFYHLEYCAYYCQKDVEVLGAGLLKMHKLTKKVTGLDIFQYITAPSLSHQNFLKEGAYEGCHKLHGITRDYIQKCVVGGRCQLYYNNKQFYEAKDLLDTGQLIEDFDANSLYPSAMYELGERVGGYLKGPAKPFINSERKKRKLTLKQLEKFDGYFVKILIKNIPKKRAFPVISKVFNKKRNWINELHGYHFLDKITLEDLQKYHGLVEFRDFDILEGYYFDEGRNPKITEIIKNLYNERIKYKNEYRIEKNGKVIETRLPKESGVEYIKKFGKDTKNYFKKLVAGDTENKYKLLKKNPIQEVYKLLMNSSYGKTIQKPIESSIVLVNNDEELKNLIRVNHNRIRQSVRIEGTQKHFVTISKSTFKHESLPQIGSEILAMSKRIMNRVMYLAEDIGIKILYQDTDSMHLKTKDLKKLKKAYKQKYGIDIDGTQMGQFCSDFNDFTISEKDPETGELTKIKVKTIGSAKFIGCGKKVYFDKLVGKHNGELVFGEHTRLKGITPAIIKLKLEQKEFKYNNSEELYTGLYQGEAVTFNLAEFPIHKPKFSFSRDYEVNTPDVFERTVSFK